MSRGDRGVQGLGGPSVRAPHNPNFSSAVAEGAESVLPRGVIGEDGAAPVLPAGGSPGPGPLLRRRRPPPRIRPGAAQCEPGPARPGPAAFPVRSHTALHTEVGDPQNTPGGTTQSLPLEGPGFAGLLLPTSGVWGSPLVRSPFQGGGAAIHSPPLRPP